MDTSVWSLALRRRQWQAHEETVIQRLRSLILDGNAHLIGVIRQELLSGIKQTEQFAKLKEHLRAFEDLPVSPQDHEEAAAMYNLCRAHGVQGSHIDFLICAVAQRYQMPLFTIDADFQHYARHLPLVLYAHSAATIHETQGKYQL